MKLPVSELLLLLICTNVVISARILSLFPLGAKSHYNLVHALLRALAARGHEVVNYSVFPLNEPQSNCTDFLIDNVEAPDKWITYDILVEMLNRSPVRTTSLLWKLVNVGHTALHNKHIKKLLESDEKFDLIIMQPLFSQEVLLGFAHKFKAPVIAVQPFGAFSLVSRAAGNPLNLAYIPDFAFPSSDHLSFYERTMNAYSILSTLYTYYNEILPAQDKYMREVFKDPTMPPLVDLVHNISLFVNNAHPNIHYTQPYTPNIIPLGGIHLAKEIKPLPQDMDKFFSEAKHGVILFSVGTVVPDQLLPKTYFNNFINAFRRLPQRVLWKTRMEIAGLPDNVLTAKWVPQQDVLAHPKTVLFMTHGGMFSQHEAINAGVPVICTPYFGDQSMNAKFYEEREIGVILLFNNISEKTIHSAITTVLDNPKYKNNMQRLSRIYNDQLIAPADNAVYWIEYVMRHGGAAHLQSVSSHMPFYQLYLLDVLGVLLLVTMVFVGIFYTIVKRLFALAVSRKSITQSKKNK